MLPRAAAAARMTIVRRYGASSDARNMMLSAGYRAELTVASSVRLSVNSSDSELVTCDEFQYKVISTRDEITVS